MDRVGHATKTWTEVRRLPPPQKNVSMNKFIIANIGLIELGFGICWVLYFAYRAGKRKGHKDYSNDHFPDNH